MRVWRVRDQHGNCYAGRREGFVHEEVPHLLMPTHLDADAQIELMPDRLVEGRVFRVEECTVTCVRRETNMINLNRDDIGLVLCALKNSIDEMERRGLEDESPTKRYRVATLNAYRVLVHKIERQAEPKQSASQSICSGCGTSLIRVLRWCPLCGTPKKSRGQEERTE